MDNLLIIADLFYDEKLQSYRQAIVMHNAQILTLA